jgi:preprotein translocase subunit SecD
MVVYYRTSGLVADVALALNGLLVLAIMAILGSTLTLPGIAGFVLTLGMAVDANVLINERIREELRHGKTVRQAVDQGYDKVFWTIVDSHVTALVAGIVLMQYGSGPVRGFAVTLIIGLIASMFTSIVVTRVIMDLLTRGDGARLSV